MNWSPLFSANQSLQCDQKTLEEEGISSLELMDRAVEALWKEMQPLLAQTKKVSFLVGPGNNGGDGLGLAKKFLENKFEVAIYILCEGKTDEWKAQWERLSEVKLEPLEHFTPQSNELVIDALFGAGFHGELSRELQDTAQALRKKDCTTWAIDVPSGCDGNKILATPNCFSSQKCFCVGVPKHVLFHPLVRELCGDYHFVDIGLTMCDPGVYLITPEWVSAHALDSKGEAHKGSHGRLQIVGGNRGMAGAGIIAASAAFKSGCGYVYIDSDDMDSILKAVPEVVTQKDAQVQATVIGPGLGRDQAQEKRLKAALEKPGPLLIDADALILLAAWGKGAVQGRPQTVLTPHAAEMGALSGTSAVAVNEDRLSCAQALSADWQVTVLLKGPGTLVAEPGIATLNPTGNQGMATAGMGDALSGIIGAFLARGLAAGKAARLGAYFHGLAGDQMSAKTGKMGILAHELIQELPGLLASK